MDATKTKALVIDASEFFGDPEFITWLNAAETLFTWHQRGAVPGERSDVVVLVDPSLSGEGSDSDMPAHIWEAIVAECRKHFLPATTPENHIMVRLQNLA